MMLLKFKCIITLAFLILNQYVLSSNARLNIERGDQDVFDNPNCKNPTGVGCNCNTGLNANCVDTCKRCRCSYTKKTFLSSNDNNGRCVKNRRLLFIPTFFNQSFSPQNINNKKCMRPKLWRSKNNIYRVRKTDCDATDFRLRWIWTRYNQIMHVYTLKCLQESTFAYSSTWSNYYYLVLGECMSTETKQHWQCLGLNKVNLKSKKSMLYMYQSDSWNYTYGTNSKRYSEDLKWRRYPSNAENLCSKSFGCYEFVKDSSVIFVTDVRNCSQQCLEERDISVPQKSGENLCFVLWEKLQYLDDEWKQLVFRNEIFSIDKRNKRTFLKLNFTKATNDWTGLIVKLNFYCAGEKLAKVNIMNTKCVVIKFKGTAFYPATVSPTVPTTQKVTTTLSIKDSSTAPSTVNAISAAEKYKRDSSPVIHIIVVCVVIVILILCGILGFILYRRRRRSECKTRSDNADIRSRDAHADPFVTFSTSAMSNNSNSAIPYVKNTESLDQAGASTAVVEDKELVDDGGYAIPFSELNTVSLDQAETSTAIPRDDKDFEDEFGYVIPLANEMTLRDQNVSSDFVPDHQYLEERLPNDSDAADSIKNEGDYEPMGERNDHVYQALLPSTSR